MKRNFVHIKYDEHNDVALEDREIYKMICDLLERFFKQNLWNRDSGQDYQDEFDNIRCIDTTWDSLLDRGIKLSMDIPHTKMDIRYRAHIRKGILFYPSDPPKCEIRNTGDISKLDMALFFWVRYEK